MAAVIELFTRVGYFVEGSPSHGSVPALARLTVAVDINVSKWIYLSGKQLQPPGTVFQLPKVDLGLVFAVNNNKEITTSGRKIGHE